MTNEHSKASLARKAKRNSPETQQFKQEIEHFLRITDADSNIAYFLRQDLKKMTHMPYYGESAGHRKQLLKPDEIAREYCNLLAQFGNPNFTRRLLLAISCQQSQTLRKLFRRPSEQISKAKSIGTSNGCWEHPIPLKFVRTELENLIHCDSEKAHTFIHVLHHVNQIFLPKEQDAILNAIHKDTMPDGWKWDAPNVDLYARYTVAQIHI